MWGNLQGDWVANLVVHQAALAEAQVEFNIKKKTMKVTHEQSIGQPTRRRQFLHGVPNGDDDITCSSISF